MPKGITNPQRKNGKAWKKKPKVQRKTGKTIGGYSLAKFKTRAEKRGFAPDLINQILEGAQMASPVASDRGFAHK